MRVMTIEEWTPLADAHAAQIDAWSLGHRTRQGERHPIEDFLWHYYSFRPSHLRRWHPGAGIGLLSASEHAGWTHYCRRDDITVVDISTLTAERRRALAWMRDLLQRSLEREPRFGCFAMHEWAMVYGLEQHQVRHEQAPLRLSPREIRDVVDRGVLRCTHYDAFRFYTPGSAPLNELQPTRETQIDLEQPGCLHANMDLYKYAMWFSPYVCSDLIADCFELARSARTLDMQASPYDVSQFGLEPIRVETPEGRLEYARLQRELMLAASPLREQLSRRLRILRDARI